jgi:HlyD family secretion protein
MSEIDTVVQGLAAQLKRRRRQRTLRALTLVGVVSCGAAGLIYYQRASAPPPPARFVTAAVETRSILEEVQSTGVVEPLNQVDIGAQVSGRIVSVDVDFNDRVKAGQLLAQIDPQLFGAEVSQNHAQLSAAQATIKSAEARRDAMKVRVDRLTRLVGDQVASMGELEEATGELQVAEAEVGSAKAQIAQIQARLSSARTTLNYTKIFSPIDGVVINRQVEPGQTVASSFNTPVLFVIAQDLTKMRVVAEIDEADVGKVKEGMEAQVTVDAFPEDQFKGMLTQIRLAPNNVEGVVTYAAVITVDNPEGKLRPGMTATTTVETRKVVDVAAVRNSALRFEPAAPPAQPGQAATPAVKDGGSSLRPEPGRGRVFLPGHGPVTDPGATAQLIDLGLTDGVWTEVKSGLVQGQQVIVDEHTDDKKRGFRLF